MLLTLMLAALASSTVCISGAVQKPGCYRLTEPMPVVQLIDLADGLRSTADGDHIQIRRAGGRVETFDYTRLFTDVRPRAIPQLQREDRVEVSVRRR